MPVNRFDQAARFAARMEPHALLAWLLGLPPVDFRFVGWLNAQSSPFPGEADRRCDTVAHFEDARRPAPPVALVVEFQLEPQPDMGLRMGEYACRLCREQRPYPDDPRVRFRPGGLVVHLTGVGNTPYASDIPGTSVRVGLDFPDRNFAVEDAGALLAEVESGARPAELLTWIPLMLGADSPGIIGRWKRLAATARTATRRSELGGLALVFADAAGRLRPWRAALEGWEMRDSVVALEWVNEGIEIGLARGVETGRAEEALASRRATLLELLAERFGKLPLKLRRRVGREESVERLRAWLRLVVSAESLEAFVAAMGE